MKFVLLHLSTAQEDWCDEAVAFYTKKLKHFVDFEVVALKPKKASRGAQATKKTEEAETLLAYLKDGDLLVLFDERGKNLTSEKFSDQVRQLHDSGKRRVIFLIGGAYGVEDSVKKRAQVLVALAPFVMNHLIAKVVALEQIYRAFTIMKGLPYHNR